MKLKRLFAAVLAAVSMLTMGMMLSGCGGAGVGEEDVPYIPGGIYSSGSTCRLLEV